MAVLPLANVGGNPENEFLAEGITDEVDIDPETGEQLYRTMRLIKANPLLEKVYRKIVMGIMDSVLPKLDSDTPEE